METNLTPELIEQAKKAESIEALLALAKENNIILTAAHAEKLFNEWHSTKELSDDELDSVAGGCGDDYDDPITCPSCGETKAYACMEKDGKTIYRCTNRLCGLYFTPGD